MGSGPGRMWKWEEAARGECWVVDLWAFLVFKSPTYTTSLLVKIMCCVPTFHPV